VLGLSSVVLGVAAGWSRALLAGAK